MENDLIKAIEQLNREQIEFINSKEYRYSRKINKIRIMIKKGKFIKLIRFLFKSRKKVVSNWNETEYNFVGQEKIDVDNSKIAIYTCILGDYDELKEPLIKMKNAKYFLFTDKREEKKESIWEKIEIPKNIKKLENDILVNRYIKMHPHEFFSEYDYAIYVDGSIRIISETNSLVNKINKKTGIAMHWHSKRKNIYEEAAACIYSKKGNKQKIINQIEKYKKEKVPKETGLFEAGIIVCDLKNNNSKKIFSLWWEEFFNTKSMRDQLSLPYVLWKNDYEFKDIGFLGNNLSQNPKFRIYSHNDDEE